MASVGHVRVELQAELQERVRAFLDGIGASLDDLSDIGAAMRTQDNECTALPLFLVQQRKRLYGFDTRFVEDVAWLRAGDEVDDADATALEAAYQETGDEPQDADRTGYMDRWEFVTAFFTRAAAEAFIATNKHRLTDPRVFVDSMHRNPELQCIREFLLRLTDQSGVSRG